MFVEEARGYLCREPGSPKVNMRKSHLGKQRILMNGPILAAHLLISPLINLTLKKIKIHTSMPYYARAVPREEMARQRHHQHASTYMFLRVAEPVRYE